MGECEQAFMAEPKSKDPFDLLPKSSFFMDEFKCKYSRASEVIAGGLFPNT